MSLDCQAHIRVGRDRDAALMRIEGRATFACGQAVKTFGLQAITTGARTIAVDCATCESMDSTMMGILVMLAQNLPTGQIHLCDTNGKVRRAITGLGLAQFFTFSSCTNQDRFAWERLTDDDTSCTLEQTEPRQVMIDAHEALVQVTPDNVARFRDVLELLRASDTKDTHPGQGESERN